MTTPTRQEIEVMIEVAEKATPELQCSLCARRLFSESVRHCHRGLVCGGKLRKVAYVEVESDRIIPILRVALKALDKETKSGVEEPYYGAIYDAVEGRNA